MSKSKRYKHLEDAAQNYYFTDQQTGIDNRCRERMIRRCLPYLRTPKVLELGFMDGQWTDHFLDKGCSVTVVEGVRRNIEFGKKKYSEQPKVEFIHELFEYFEPDQTFDTILMGGMLKHLEEPEVLLERAKEWLNPDGILIATTPNARSMHRQIGVHMGLLDDIFALTNLDEKVANLRHYDITTFRNLLENTGYKVVTLGTAVIKFLSSEGMKDFDDALLDALDHLADELPERGWYIYAICQKGND